MKGGETRVDMTFRLIKGLMSRAILDFGHIKYLQLRHRLSDFMLQNPEYFIAGTD